MHMKLKKRELRLTLYDGEELVMRYPTSDEHDEFMKKIIAEPEKDNEITRNFYKELGMSDKVYKVLQKPDLLDIGMVLTGQKKI